MPASLEWLGIPEFAAALERTVARSSAAAREAVVQAAAEVEKQAKQNASGRPGPNVVTGTLRRSITHKPVTPWGLRGWQTEIGPTVIYGRRIELGFTGTDSRGRHFNQRGYPYFAPAWNSVLPRLESIFAARWRAALTGL